MNIRLSLAKKEMDQSLDEFAKILDAYSVMLSDSVDTNTDYTKLKEDLKFPQLESADKAMHNQAWTTWKAANIKGESSQWPLFKIYVRECMQKLAIFRNALNRCGEKSTYEQLLEFLNRADNKDKQDKIIIMEEHFLTDPADALISRVKDMQKFTNDVKLPNCEEFHTKEEKSFKTLLDLLIAMEKQIEQFNLKDDKVDVKQFLEWRNPEFKM